METIDDKIDNGVHAALYAMGLNVANNMQLAENLSNWLHENAAVYLTDDDEAA
jgi:hypothetical protein